MPFLNSQQTIHIKESSLVLVSYKLVEAIKIKSLFSNSHVMKAASA
jgi:hypothetical protein